jgi:hypothetical protein
MKPIDTHILRRIKAYFDRDTSRILIVSDVMGIFDLTRPEVKEALRFLTDYGLLGIDRRSNIDKFFSVNRNCPVNVKHKKKREQITNFVGANWS